MSQTIEDLLNLIRVINKDNITININGKLDNIHKHKMNINVNISPILSKEEKEILETERIKKEINERVLQEKRRMEFEGTLHGNYW